MSRQSKWFNSDSFNKLQLLVAGKKDERKLELNQILQKLGKLNKDEVEKSDKYYPIRFLSDGVLAYISSFDNAAIYYASSAVELAIITRLAENTSLVGEGLGFKRLIELAAKISLLDSTAKKKAHDIRRMRNSYIHYYNIMRHQAYVDAESRERLEAWMPEVQEYIRVQVNEPDQGLLLEQLEDSLSNLREDKIIIQREIPVQGIQPNTESLDFLEKRSRRYVKWIAKATAAEPEEFLRRYDYGIERYDALDCLRWSKYILVKLRFL